MRKGTNEGTRRGARTRPPCAVYVRISDDREGRQLGVTRQEEDCRRLADRLGYTVAEVFPDNDISASTGKRREHYEEMMRRAEAGEFAAILFYSTSRLTRRVLEYERLIRLVEHHGVRLASVASGEDDLTTADGRMVARIKASVDQAESERIAERVKRAARQRAEQGKWHGGVMPPFGYELVKTADGHELRLHPQNAALLQEAARRLLNGESLYGVCNDWNERGLTTQGDAHWRSKTLRNALLSPSAVALRHTVDDETGEERLHETAWEPVLDRLTWERLRDVLRDPARSTWNSVAAPYGSKMPLGGGLTVCGGQFQDGTPCGRKLMTQKHRGRDRLICHRQATGGCGTVTIDHEHLQEWALGLVWEVLDTPEMRESLAARSDTTEDQQLRLELAEVERQLDRNYGAYLDEIVDKDRYLRTKADLEERGTRIESRLADVMGGLVLGAVPSLRAAQDRWKHGDTPWRRAFLSSLIRSVTVSRFPQGMASTLTRYTKRGETDEQYAERQREHRAAIMRKRVEIDWRA